MKQIFTLLIVLGFSFNISAQSFSEDSVSLGAGYNFQSFYDMETGEVENISNTNWTLSFSVGSQTSSIYLNGGNGVELYATPADTGDFGNNLDTTNYLSNWNRLYDDNTTWDGSAFEAEATGGAYPIINYGWGTYDANNNHKVTGDAVFLLKTGSGDFYKFWIQLKNVSEWTFRYATINNSWDTTIVYDCTPHLDRNFVYYSLDQKVFNSIEPVNTTWDILFREYLGDFGVAGGGYHTTAAVLANKGIEVAEAVNLAPADANHASQIFDDVVNEIGHDWKNFDFMTSQWTLTDSLSYFVKKADGNIYQIYFTDFEGSMTGKVKFNTKQVHDVTAVSIRNNEVFISDFTVYPNPSHGNTNIIYTPLGSTSNLTLTITDITGKEIQSNVVDSSAGLKAYSIDCSNWHSGIYLVSLKSDQKVVTKKLIVK